MTTCLARVTIDCRGVRRRPRGPAAGQATARLLPGLTLATWAALSVLAAGCSPKADTPWSSGSAASAPEAAAVASAPASASGTVSAASAAAAPASDAAAAPATTASAAGSMPASAPTGSASSPTTVAPASGPASGSAGNSSASGTSAAAGGVGGAGTSGASATGTVAHVALAPDLPLLVPVEGVRPDQLVDTYEQSRSEGRTHEAIDILAPRGTPVKAVAEGRVAKLFNSRLGGLTVYQFDRQERVAYYYAHLDAYAPGLKEGQVLKRGDLVGTVGFTGNADPQAPHLHFAVFLLGPERRWWEGSPVNPYPLMQPAVPTQAAAGTVPGRANLAR